MEVGKIAVLFGIWVIIFIAGWYLSEKVDNHYETVYKDNKE